MLMVVVGGFGLQDFMSARCNTNRDETVSTAPLIRLNRTSCLLDDSLKRYKRQHVLQLLRL